jgi:hypothetical protein
MQEFLIDNIFVVVCGQVFQQSVEISMGTNCVPLFFGIWYEAEFIQKLLREKKFLLWPSIRLSISMMF